MSLPRDMIALPLPDTGYGCNTHVGSGKDRKKVRVVGEFDRIQTHYYVRINYPYCFEHKDYPACGHCLQKYVPIEDGDIMCFKCKFLQP